MNQPAVLLPPSPHAFSWPVDVTRYDRSPHLHEAERVALKQLMQQPPFQLLPSTKGLLHRLLRPIQDVFAVTHPSPNVCHETMRIMLIEMYHRGKTFWAWSEEEWIDVIGSSYTAFARRYGRTYGTGQHPTRRELPVLAYLLCTPATIDPLLLPFAIAPIARKVFGTQTIGTHVQQLTAVLGTWGYREKITMTSSLASAISCCATVALSLKR